MRTLYDEELLDLDARLDSASDAHDFFVRRRDQQCPARRPPPTASPAAARPSEPGLVVKPPGYGTMLDRLVALTGKPRDEVSRCFNFCDYDFELARDALTC
jgi:hypothetical protein